MKIFHGNTSYDFTVSQNIGAASSDGEGFKVEFVHKKSQSEQRTSLNIPFIGQNQSSLMSDLLQEFNVPEPVRNDMAAHFTFQIDRMNRLSRRNRVNGLINVLVRLEVTENSSQRVAAISRRMELRRIERDREINLLMSMDREVEVVPPLATKREVVEKLEREAMVIDDDDDSECSICLEKFLKGIEVLLAFSLEWIRI
ncbi:uncharacterized protein LOC130798629 [Amaranthus tricolor]|uniref:uncharacterized protein LOC130798629 n=1 Tax=Amaranthus tricolor TaxID=29722 RepID=UPI00258E341F|nr:uncharacterized protein LOC130798629 [Amaranthus tricolor]